VRFCLRKSWKAEGKSTSGLRPVCFAFSLQPSVFLVPRSHAPHGNAVRDASHRLFRGIRQPICFELDATHPGWVPMRRMGTRNQKKFNNATTKNSLDGGVYLLNRCIIALSWLAREVISAALVFTCSPPCRISSTRELTRAISCAISWETVAVCATCSFAS